MQGNNKSTAGDSAQGSSMGKSTPIVGSKSGGSPAKQHPTMGLDTKSTNLKNCDFKRVSSGY